MTHAARASKEIRSKEKVEKDKLFHDARQKHLQREQDVAIANAQMKNDLKKAKIGALGSIGGGIAKGAFSKGGFFTRNEPKWYKNYLPDLEAFVRIPTYDRLGARFLDHYGLLSTKHHFIPGILIMRWIPTVGPQPKSAPYFRNAVNQSLARTREKVLALNSRSSVSWESGDLGFNLFCSADIATLITELGRVIKVYQTYRPRNAYLAKALITALGWDYTDMETYYAEYRKTYMVLARKFNSAIVAPRSISLYDRRLFLASNIFVDNDDVKNPRQMYAYVQSAAFKLGDTEESCTCLSTANWKSSIVTFSAAIQLLFSAITDSPAFVEMYEDLRHAFGDDLLQLPIDIEKEEIEFNSNSLNREQIHNLVIAPLVGQTGSPTISSHLSNFDLCQDTSGYLYQGPINGGASDRKLVYAATDRLRLEGFTETWFNERLSYNAKLLCNMHKSDVDGDDIIDITRGMFMGECTLDSNDVLSILVTSCGTEVIESASVYYYADTSGTISLSSDKIGRFWAAVSSAGNVVHIILGELSAFDWAPITQTTRIISSAEHSATHMDAFTTFEIKYNELYDIHEACVMGELYLGDAGFKR